MIRLTKRVAQWDFRASFIMLSCSIRPDSFTDQSQSRSGRRRCCLPIGLANVHVRRNEAVQWSWMYQCFLSMPSGLMLDDNYLETYKAVRLQPSKPYVDQSDSENLDFVCRYSMPAAMLYFSRYPPVHPLTLPPKQSRSGQTIRVSDGSHPLPGLIMAVNPLPSSGRDAFNVPSVLSNSLLDRALVPCIPKPSKISLSP